MREFRFIRAPSAEEMHEAGMRRFAQTAEWRVKVWLAMHPREARIFHRAVENVRARFVVHQALQAACAPAEAGAGKKGSDGISKHQRDH